MSNALVFDIQHFSLHDGPGIRTTAFLKGCSLNCAWCHNPESIDVRNGIFFEAMKCIGCRACEAVCKNGVHSFEGGIHKVDFSKCVSCGACAEVCFPGALKMIASYYESRELAEILLRDRGLYEKSGGGVTFSGGEALLRPDFVAETAEILKKEKVHICVDTALNVPWDNIEKVMPCCDLFLCDLKLISEDRSKKHIGSSNRLILENLKRLSREKKIFIRIPVIKGVNDDLEELSAIKDFIGTLGENVLEVGILSYHDLGVSKAEKVGKVQHRFEIQKSEDFEEKIELFRNRGYRLLFDGNEVK